MKYDFLPFKIKFVKRRDLYKKNKFCAIVDFEDTEDDNIKHISLYSNCPDFNGYRPKSFKNKHKTPFVYSFYTIYFNGNNNFQKNTIKKTDTKRKILKITKTMLSTYGFSILEESIQFEEIEI